VRALVFRCVQSGSCPLAPGITVDRLNVAQRQFTECKRVASPIRSTLRPFAARRIRGERALLFCVVESTPGTAHVDFPLLQRIALLITIGSVRYPGIKSHETRIIRKSLADRTLKSLASTSLSTALTVASPPSPPIFSTIVLSRASSMARDFFRRERDVPGMP
jgi:hypothetical protein